MEPTKASKPKDKRRNNEKRKEKSRDAARCRRSRETEIFSELAGALPLPKDVVSQLDKASIMRLAISYLKIRNIATILPEIEPPKELSEADNESVFLKALDGFMMVLSDEGDIAYLSENVKDFLGISQVDLMGQNIYEYSHPCDHEEVRDILATKPNSDQNESLSKSFFLRLKCTHTSKGRNVNLKSASYKVIHFSGHIIIPDEDEKLLVKEGEESTNKSVKQKCLISIGQPIPHPSNIEVPLDKKTFLSKHSLDMKFTYADEKMLEVLGFDPDELIGKSIYEYHHALDSEIICSRFKTLFSKGQCETSKYRFLAKKGGFVWVVTQATVIHDKFHKPQSVVCVHNVISGIVCSDEICSIAQSSCIDEVKEKIIIEDESNDTKDNIPKVVPIIINNKDKENTIPNIGIADLVRCTTAGVKADGGPQTATSLVFTKKTEDMNKGFLMFSAEEPGLTILKDEPDDLTHLAPTAGDVCVPLADNPFFPEMFDDFILDENYCPLLTDDLGSLDSSQCSTKSTNNSVTSDPFMAYRDDFDLNKSDSPQLLSPHMSHSPGSSLPSLCSPGTSLHEDDQLKTFMSLQMDSEEDSQFSNKAPYISMSVTDDLPLLNTEDLMWGALPEEKSPKPKTETSFNSSLAQLLCQKTNKSYKTHDHGGGLLNISDFVYQKYTDTKEIPDNWILQDTNSLIHIHNKTPPEMIKPIKTVTERPQKRVANNHQYGTISKRCKNEPKEKLSSELLNQLMSNTTPSRAPSKGDWCKSRSHPQQPSDSVLMNLLDERSKDATKPEPMETSPPLLQQSLDKRLPNISILLGNRKMDESRLQKIDQTRKERHEVIRKNSFSLLDPRGETIPSLLDLSEQDYDVNAPINDVTALLQGYELLNALECSDPFYKI